MAFAMKKERKQKTKRKRLYTIPIRHKIPERTLTSLIKVSSLQLGLGLHPRATFDPTRHQRFRLLPQDPPQQLSTRRRRDRADDFDSSSKVFVVYFSRSNVLIGL